MAVEKDVFPSGFKNLPPLDTLTPENNPNFNPDKQSLKDLEKERFQKDTSHRGTLMLWVIWTDSIWLGFIIFFIALQGFGCIHLDNTVFCTLLATTTINVLGLAFIVLKGMFMLHSHD